MGRIARGFRLARASWHMLMADKELLVLPVLSFLGILGAAVAFFAVGWGFDIDAVSERQQPMHYVFLCLFYFVTYSIGIFFNAAIVGAAMIRLKGGDPTVGDGIRAAMSKLPKILGWAALSSSVGLLLRMLEEKAGFLGKIVIAIVGVAWGVVTFFVIPVLLFEPHTVGGSVKRSASIFKQRWGEQFVGNASIGLALFLVAIPVIVLVVLLAMAAPILGIVVGVLAIGALGAIGAALSGIFSTALYRYATEGAVSGDFTEDDFQGAFRPKKAKA